MSVWGNYQSQVTLPPGVPDVRIRWSPEDGAHRVYADGQEVFVSAEGYYPAHRWCQNKWRLTSSMMLPVYSDYHADTVAREAPEEEAPQAEAAPEQAAESPAEQPAAKPPNKYRKPGT